MTIFASMIINNTNARRQNLMNGVIKTNPAGLDAVTMLSRAAL